MKRVVIRAVLVVIATFASTGAFAQDEADPRTLDLSVPAERIHFASTGADASRSDPPGAWQPITPAQAEQSIANDWQVHGAVEAGVGWSERGGNSNWQAVNLNLGKTTYDDEGDARHFNIDINLGRGEGPVFGPGGLQGPGYYGPAPGPVPFRGRGPIVR